MVLVLKLSTSESDGKRKGRNMSLSNSNRMYRAEGRFVNAYENVNNENNGNNTNYVLNNDRSKTMIEVKQ